MSTVKTQKQRLVLWIAAALFAIGLAGAPTLAGTASADCTVFCIGTTGGGECTEWVGEEGVLAVCVSD